MKSIKSPLAGTVADLPVTKGQIVRPGSVVIVIESMKMLHEIRSEHHARILSIDVTAAELIEEGQILLSVVEVEESALGSESLSSEDVSTGSSVRENLQELRTRLEYTLDIQRPDAVAKRHAMGMRTARENIADLCDPDSFSEYGAMAVAAQRGRRSLEDLIENTPADGLITGIGSINGEQFGPDASRCVVMAYDATVLAGTQGLYNHQKTDRLLGIALQQNLPVVLFAEGGGGRPGDTDATAVAGLHLATFGSYARLSGRVPVIGIAAGRCFAGNAALLGCSDVIIATRGSNIGMGGPAMIEGGGLGKFRPEQIGPSDVQNANGVIDILVDDEAQATAAAKHYLSFFQGRLSNSTCRDQTLLREALPEHRAQTYAMRNVMEIIVDRDSLLELRSGFGKGILTALARIDGRPIGLMASNPLHLGGAIDADAADKGARFLQLCNTHQLPVVSLIDTPGFMVGPDIEARAQVRHVSRMFLQGANLRVPFFAVILRKGYGLGAMAMAGGGFHTPVATVAWPSGEFGAMGIEGAVRLGFSKELAAQGEGAAREGLFKSLVDQAYAQGKAINMASALEIDAVIDPAETRDWLLKGLMSARCDRVRAQPIDSW
jgi:acetyl-CoA carboxylase carboxyltransferase component